MYTQVVTRPIPGAHPEGTSAGCSKSLLTISCRRRASCDLGAGDILEAASKHYLSSKTAAQALTGVAEHTDKERLNTNEPWRALELVAKVRREPRLGFTRTGELDFVAESAVTGGVTMGSKRTEITDQLRNFIERQRLFFVATADCEGRINISPKGLDTLRVLGANRVVWLNLTGSGNETAAHLQRNDRITIMLCAFEGDPLILRLYGHGRVYHPRNPQWRSLIGLFPLLAGARQIIDMTVDLVQTSCGMAVPRLVFKAERDELEKWARRKGEEGIRAYWREKNQLSLDGKPTKILAD